MPKRTRKQGHTDPVTDAIKDLLIVQLALAGVRGHAIRKVVGCGMARVTQITRHLKARNDGRD
jgi:hypothetical protein